MASIVASIVQGDANVGDARMTINDLVTKLREASEMADELQRSYSQEQATGGVLSGRKLRRLKRKARSDVYDDIRNIINDFKKFPASVEDTKNVVKKINEDLETLCTHVLDHQTIHIIETDITPKLTDIRHDLENLLLLIPPRQNNQHLGHGLEYGRVSVGNNECRCSRARKNECRRFIARNNECRRLPTENGENTQIKAENHECGKDRSKDIENNYSIMYRMYLILDAEKLNFEAIQRLMTVSSFPHPLSRL